MQEEILGFSIFYDNNNPEGVHIDMMREMLPPDDWNFVLSIWNHLPKDLENLQVELSPEELKSYVMTNLKTHCHQLNAKKESLAVVDVTTLLFLVYLAEKLEYIPSDEVNGIVCYTPSYIELARKLRNSGQWN
jgi:hypothetical protein